MSTNNVLIGKRIRASRERLGMNQSELARKAGVTPSYLNRAEIGAFQAPSVEKLSAIATALGLKLADLTGESEPLDEDVAAQIERLDPADRKLVSEAIDDGRVAVVLNTLVVTRETAPMVAAWAASLREDGRRLLAILDAEGLARAGEQRMAG